MVYILAGVPADRKGQNRIAEPRNAITPSCCAYENDGGLCGARKAAAGHVHFQKSCPATSTTDVGRVLATGKDIAGAGDAAADVKITDAKERDGGARAVRVNAATF